MIETKTEVTESGCDSTWTARTLATLIGVPHTAVAQWVKLDLVDARKGKGKSGHKIGLRGLLQSLTIASLRDEGLSIEQVKKAVENLQALTREIHWEQWTFLVVFPKTNECDVLVELQKEDELMTSVLRYPGKRFMLFQIGLEAKRRLGDSIFASNESECEVKGAFSRIC